jgi:hypothetical protein
MNKKYELENIHVHVRFQVLTAASMMFRAVFWVILPCKMIVDRRFRGAYCLHLNMHVHFLRVSKSSECDDASISKNKHRLGLLNIFMIRKTHLF